MWNKSIWREAYNLETIIRPNFVYISFSYLDFSLPLGCYGNLFLGFCAGSNYSFYPCLCGRSNSPWSNYLMFILNNLAVVSFESLRGSAVPGRSPPCGYINCFSFPACLLFYPIYLHSDMW